jgi:hypothetical protein
MIQLYLGRSRINLLVQYKNDKQHTEVCVYIILNGYVNTNNFGRWGLTSGIKLNFHFTRTAKVC